MRCLPRTAFLIALVAIAPVLAGCSDFDPSSFDLFGLSSKKPLPGKRELLFPNGVPGVTEGIPPQYKEGYRAPGISDLPPGDSDATNAGASQTAKSVPTKPVQESDLGKPMRVHRTVVRHKSKPKPRVVKRKVEPKATATAAKPKSTPKGTVAPWPSTPQQTAAQPKGTQAPWPSTPAKSSTASQESQSTQAGWPSAKDSQAADQKLAPWPSAPAPGSFSK